MRRRGHVLYRVESRTAQHVPSADGEAEAEASSSSIATVAFTGRSLAARERSSASAPNRTEPNSSEQARTAVTSARRQREARHGAGGVRCARAPSNHNHL